ncbi:hypothetical protein Cni_G21726 [Canna indica]|uniref:Protein kinase domain-containing protein n=1 Tax=Canna indica TaxID=4628 RepID=A0AAQ3KQ34_9LILI|nr:hypothetical protein Cni_G21726 [Canna indica]
MSLAAGPPVSAAASASVSILSSSAPIEKGRDGLGNVLRVLRNDGNFLRDRLRPLSKPLGNLLWLRNLEDPRAQHAARPPAAWPRISHPQGLSGLDLMKADFEALKVYANRFQDTYKFLFMPLPEVYDPEKVALYFSFRPHILAFRVTEVFLSFASAAIKLQTSKTFNLNKHSDNQNHGADSSQYLIGQLVKESLLNLGPTFIKVGQSLSTRPDIIGSDISKALSELHDKVPAFPRNVAMNIIEEEFGRPVESIFSYISEEPVAAASFGQVYRGCTLDGGDVAIKVQRPDLLHAVTRDIYILRLGLALLRKAADRKSDICLYADELGKGLVGELDYTREAANATEFLEAHSQYSFILAPKVFMTLTSKRVLTMEWIIGENPNELLVQSKESNQESSQYLERQTSDAKVHLFDMVKKGVEATLIQLLDTGLLHADPHPGNLRYTPEGHIGFLDFGLLCRMEKKHQLAMFAAIIHIVNGDWTALVYDLVEMDVGRPGTNLRAVAMDLEEALGEVVFINGIPDVKFSRVLGKIWSVALKYHFRMPPYFTLVLRSLASFEGLAVAADRNFKTFQAAYHYVARKLLYDNSAATRKILFSVVLNKRRELQWQRILLFLRLSYMRKSTETAGTVPASRSSSYVQTAREDFFETANLILRLLTSKEGAVFRRILITANSTSLARAFVSKDALSFRANLGAAFADIFFQWMSNTVSRNEEFGQYSQPMIEEGEHKERKLGSSSALSVPLLQNVLADRRLKVIFYKILNDVRRDSILMLRVCWSLSAVLLRAVALAMHRFIVYCSEAYHADDAAALEVIVDAMTSAIDAAALEIVDDIVGPVIDAAADDATTCLLMLPTSWHHQDDVKAWRKAATSKTLRQR